MKSWCCRTGLNCRPPPYQGDDSAAAARKRSQLHGFRGGTFQKLTAVAGTFCGHGYPIILALALAALVVAAWYGIAAEHGDCAVRTVTAQSWDWAERLRGSDVAPECRP
jgi:hypothetical protein